MGNDETIEPLREALRASPDNTALRVYFAKLLIRRGYSDEAERVCREGLTLAPASEQLKEALADTFVQQGKHSAAIVILEELMQKPDCSASAHLLHARLLLRAGQIERAAHAYRRATALDPSLADQDLAEALGVRQSANIVESTQDDDDVDEYGRIRVRCDDQPSSEVALELERPTICFADVGGMDDLKEQIRMKIIHPMTHPDLYKAYGKPIGGGVLMYGPPGCGKTYLARATAGEVKAGFLAVGIHDVLDMFIGQSEMKLHSVFEQARRHAPCVLFFDEVDALGASRTDMRQSAARQLINQFLSELDGVKSSNDGVLILAATNAPWHLDSAFRRPGRFDRVLFVPPPDAAARAAILRVLLRGKPLGDVDHEQIASRTDGFSGADLKAVVDVAVEAKLSEALKQGVPSPLSTKDLLRAVKSLKPTTKEWFAAARNYALYANQGGAYDDILHYLKMT